MIRKLGVTAVRLIAAFFLVLLSAAIQYGDQPLPLGYNIALAVLLTGFAATAAVMIWFMMGEIKDGK